MAVVFLLAGCLFVCCCFLGTYLFVLAWEVLDGVSGPGIRNPGYRAGFLGRAVLFLDTGPGP